MKKQDLTNDGQKVLPYLVLIDAYVKRNDTSDDEDEEDSLCDRFAVPPDDPGYTTYPFHKTAHKKEKLPPARQFFSLCEMISTIFKHKILSVAIHD